MTKEKLLSELKEEIAVKFTKLVGSYGSVEKNLDMQGVYYGFDAAVIEVTRRERERADILLDALKLMGMVADTDDEMDKQTHKIINKALSAYQKSIEGDE